MQLTAPPPTVSESTQVADGPSNKNSLESLAKQLAAQQVISKNEIGKPMLLTQLPDQERTVLRAYHHFSKAEQEEVTLSFAAEWLLDNFSLVQATIRQVREDMPKTYYRQLPRLGTTAWHGYPRIYALAHELVAYYRCALDFEGIKQFIQVYQADGDYCTMGELWAFPIMLRLAILDNLTKTLSRLMSANVSQSISQPVPLVSDDGSVGDSITSLRMLAAQDWKLFFESVSQVEQILRQDPAGIYTHMDFDTRNDYRSVIERLADASGSTEEAVARQVITLSKNAGAAPRESHIGFYLLDAGKRQLEDSLNYHPTLPVATRRWVFSHSTFVYLGGITLLTVTILLLLMSYAANAGATAIQVILAGLIGFIPTTAVAVNLVNWLITSNLPPRRLPRLDFQKGIPADYQTMVVIPALLTTVDEIDSLVQQLELHYVRNSDPSLYFALLTDYADAPDQHQSEDEALIEHAQAGIAALNAKYQRTISPFYMFHRERRWNAVQSCWMGWERKRGKLVEFNRLLRQRGPTSYVVQVGDLDVLPDIKYVITLDADTVLPEDSAQRLVSALAHPLNHAQIDPQTAKVVAGYAILQPRTEIKPISANQSLFTRIFAGDTGLDLYTRAVSDVYQDFFGEGIYVGKGIYDVDALIECLDQRIPDNTLLSHDLFEGLFACVALITDTQLLEDFPAQYLAHTRRLHRWIRGDWQLLPWLLSGTQPLSALDRWKILDNLRRSLVMPALLVMLIAVWLGLPGSALVWTLVGISTLGVSLITSIVGSLLHRTAATELRDLVRPIRLDALRWLLALVFLPYEAALSLSAIGITLVRLYITHKNLLEWATAAYTARLLGKAKGSLLAWGEMIVSPVLAVALGMIIALLNPSALLVALPLLVAWAIAPQIAYWISRPTETAETLLSAEQETELRFLARQTWLFFEYMVGPEDHWLPPDHFQEAPAPNIAHRTSPTNIGLLILSTLAAYDLGYTGQLDLIARLQATFETLGKLERYRGHLLNWYNTQTFEPLAPRYVSTVDSGNWAGALIVLKQVCLALPDVYIMRVQRWQGLLDTLALLEKSLGSLRKIIPVAEFVALSEHTAAIRQQVQIAQQTPENQAGVLAWLIGEGQKELARLIVTLIESETPIADREMINDLRLSWERVYHHLANMQRDVNLLLPWLLPVSQPPVFFSRSDLEPSISVLWNSLTAALPLIPPPLREITAVCEQALVRLKQLTDRLQNASGPADQLDQARTWCTQLTENLSATRSQIENLLMAYQAVAAQAETYFQEMDFSFLFNDQRKIFNIGYNVDAGKLDGNFYDLLASEVRLTSLLAIAKRDVPQSHWLHLGRPVTKIENKRVLLSWSGTMFEYLMPALIMESYEHTLLTQSCRTAVEYQISYANERNVPWGISEASYYAFGGSMDYQYRAFGVPALGFKRGLSDDLVITPYASMLALRFNSQAVRQNIDHLDSLKMRGRYGLYEAVDYTRARLPLRQDHAIVRSYMAHHQGMILVSLANYLTGDRMISRFHADPRVQSVELLLQEKIPDQAPIEYPNLDQTVTPHVVLPHVSVVPWNVAIDTPVPQAHILSNGRYSTLITSAGSGYSFWQGTALTRWRPDTTLDSWGTWIYVQDQDSGAFWSAAYQPTAVVPENQRVQFSAHQVEFQRADRGVSLTTQVTVAADDDVEIRRITLVNRSDQVRRLRLVSYGEVLLAPQAERHPAFNKMFVESEYVAASNLLLFHRRLRAPDDKPIFFGQLLITDSETVTGDYEGDRKRFLGRGRNNRSPIVLQKGGPDLSRTVGATLDPIMSLAQEIILEPHTTARLAYIMLATESREQILDLAERYRTWPVVERAFDTARRQNELALRQLDLGTADLASIEQLLSLILFPNAGLRASPDVLSANSKGQSGLWAYAISGDYPILLVRIDDAAAIGLIQEVVQGHRYWRNQQLMIDVVILNLHDSSYSQELRDQIHRLIVRTDSTDWLNRRCGIFVLNADQMNEADRTLLHTVAGAVLDGQHGSLAEQLSRLRQRSAPLPAFTPALISSEAAEPTPPLARPAGLQFDNGWGGFSADSKEYVIFLEKDKWTPTPWVNVIANPNFGFLASESGAGYSWAENSGENRLTPWRNDPVSDTPGEALYLRDEETGIVWSPTPLPSRDSEPYLVRHGAGYSIFQHHSQGLKQHLQLFIAPDAPVKIIKLRLENAWSRPRRVTITYYAEWVLGVARSTSQSYTVSEFDHDSGALLARNAYNAEFGGSVAFLAANKAPHGLTTDRTEFLGRMGNLNRPAALDRVGLASTVGAGLDPCAALQLHVDLPVGGSEEVFFLIGQGKDKANALQLVHHYQDSAQIEAAWQATQKFWDELLGAVTVHTPDPAMDLMLNRWLLYQALSCRIWGRSALYQSSGAFGFRDQLQDVMGLMHAAPAIAREHILRSARHQFEAGDVLHWWHPPSGRGVRTRISDDMLWLPFVVAHYVELTGDSAILNEKIPFLQGDALKAGEDERYALYKATDATYTLYEHCVRAIKRGSTRGVHGLPLMGTGDWNDGMNRVGIQGRGESIWVGWFLYSVLMRFSPLCKLMEDSAQADNYCQQAQQLKAALETDGWDGRWYRRAYFDDGIPLGAAENRECKIDSIAQSWSVLSGAGTPEHQEQAMVAVIERLVRPADQAVLLLTPPFDNSAHNPGYIQGYPPGIRENGGQYTHGAVWAVWAFAQLGHGDRAGDLFNLLNPISHSDTSEKVERYGVEPYVIVADVYSVSPHVGQGGWTWYTGSASWMYRLGIEAILGLQRKGDTLQLDPCIPANWPGYDVTYRDGETLYTIHVQNPHGVQRGVLQTTVDGQVIPDGQIPLVKDGQKHEVHLQLGTQTGAAQ
ncbi:MAG: GH36-type glycosyl hydrolase domain-containing protein [Aggregatilineales bacterium]